MWSCPQCGNHNGMMIEDQQLSSMLCMHPDCGRVDPLDSEEVRASPDHWVDSDM